jgi:hypothetical protein
MSRLTAPGDGSDVWQSTVPAFWSLVTRTPGAGVPAEVTGRTTIRAVAGVAAAFDGTAPMLELTSVNRIARAAGIQARADMWLLLKSV